MFSFICSIQYFILLIKNGPLSKKFVTKVILCMQVTKQEVHRIWAGLKEKLYTQDVTWIKKQIDSVVSYTTRLLSLHQRDSFLTHFQAVDLQVGMCSRNRE